MTQELFSSTTTPLTPPKLEEDRLSWLRLFRSRGVGVHTFFRLMQEHGSAQQVLDRLPDLAAKAGVRKYQPASDALVRAEYRDGARMGARLICFGEDDYPQTLSVIPDPPPVIWVKGRCELFRDPMVAIVGARNASSLGERMARKLALDLGAHGFAVVSGLARGIDTAAHEAALETGTIAVLGGGLDVAYPRENQRLQDRIAKAGLLVSEQPIGTTPQSRHFPRRNRIITGLSLGTIVVEAAARSGSLLSARNAADQGREVMAVPGHPMDGRASGCNMLLRDGAALVRSAEDVIEALEGCTPAANTPVAPRPVQDALPLPGPDAEPRPILHDVQSALLNRLGPVPTAEDQLVRDLNLAPGALAGAVLDLEIAGKIQRHAGGLISRC
ncbi:DNA-processing protein DprA [Fluviibacterium sp. DFM31]|uniref:DNA-processing protein DprA n=1 Tax=Meridianimarinicoccus marinus TaxID=3231483 RepID=A0ABV3L106_9RHOB